MVIALTDTVGGLPFSGTDYNNNLQTLENAFLNVAALNAANTFSAEPQTFSAAAAASTQRGVVNIGSGGFTGGAGHFAGHASGTQLAVNAPSGFGGNLIEAQLNGASRLSVSAAGNLTALGVVNGQGGFTGPAATIRTADTGSNTIVFPVLLSHTNTAGAGAAGIGVGINFEVESATEGSVSSVGSVSCYAVDPTFGAQYGEMRLRVPAAGTNDNVVLIYPRRVRVPQQPLATANYALLNVGHGGWEGAAGHFAGNANGTAIAANLTGGSLADLLNLQAGGVSRLRVTNAGAIGFHGAAPVAQDTGWSVANVTTDRTFDANATTLDEISDVLGTLIQALIAKGLLGA